MSDTGFGQIPTGLARDGSITPAAKAVYVALTTYASKGEESWPSHKTLADNTGTSVATVARHLDWLRAEGYVSWKPHKTASDGWTSNRYRTHYPPLDAAGRAALNERRPTRGSVA